MRALLRSVAPGALLSLVLCSIVLVAWSRELDEQKRYEARCEELEHELSKLRNLSKKRPELAREIENLESQHGQLHRLLPDSREAAGEQLRRSLEGCGLAVVEMRSRTAGEVGPDHAWIHWHLRARPVGRTWIEPLRGVDQWPLPFAVDSVRVSSPRDPESELEIEGHVTVRCASPCP